MKAVRHYKKGLKNEKQFFVLFVSKIVHNKKLTEYENRENYRT